MNYQMFRELKSIFEEIGDDKNARVVILRGHGDLFSSGLDVADVGVTIFKRVADYSDDFPRRAGEFQKILTDLQVGVAAPEKLKIPVIAAIHGLSHTTSMDLTCCCDIRLTTIDCIFGLNEVNIGLSSDLGPFQRIPKLVGNESLLRELILTGRDFTGAEARELGYVSHAYDTNEELFEEALKMATTIAKKSQVGVIGAKNQLIYARDHAVEDGLKQIREWNSCMLQTKDIGIAMAAAAKGEEPKFDSW